MQDYEQITTRDIVRWVEQRDFAGELGKRGPKINLDFQREVWGQIVLAVFVITPKGEKKIKVKENIAYTYAILRLAAQTVQRRLHWLDDEKVQKLKFSNHYLRDFLRRNLFSRRKVTTAEKAIPTQAVVRKVMEEHQDTIKDLCMKYIEIGNMDETAFQYALGPSHQFIPKNQPRAVGVSKTTEKVRITAAITPLASGKQLPLFIILKHSRSSKEAPDQTSMTVVKKLHMAGKGFGSDDGWDLDVWCAEVAFDRDKPSEKATHRVWYLKHRESGHVITSQFKAYNDTIRMLMYLDLVIKGYMTKEQLDQFLLWMDNFSAHATKPIYKLMKEIGISEAFFPANMTHILQVCDLIINGPIKRHVRTQRALKTFEAFQLWLDEYAQMPKEKQRRAKFKPPAPDLAVGILELIEQFSVRGEFTTPSFEKSVANSFIATGCAPEREEGTKFVQYTEIPSNRYSKKPKDMLPVLDKDAMVSEGEEGLDDSEFASLFKDTLDAVLECDSDSDAESISNAFIQDDDDDGND